jgi:hypothetical protein
MDIKASTSPFFVPFFPHSVNIISASTNSGKTTLLINIIKNRNFCFFRPITRVVVVLGNEKVDGSIYKDLEDDSLDIELVYSDNFSVEEHLQANDVLIFEDVSRLTKDILECVNVNAHHLDLASVFVVCQSVFLKDEFRTLLSLSHQIFIYFSGAGGTKLAQHIRQFFYVNSDLKDYLKSIISYAEKYKNLVLLELNEIARSIKPNFIAISGFENIFNMLTNDDEEAGPTVVFPQYHKQNLYKKEFGDNETEVDNIDPSSLPRGSYLLVPAENVRQRSKHSVGGKISDKHDQWNDINEKIIESIESSAQNYKKIQPAKNLAKSVLNNKHLSLYNDGKVVMVKNQPKTSTALLDYLHAATRMSGPNEIPNPKFVLFTKLLLQSNTPVSFIKNKSLLNAKMNSKKINNFIMPSKVFKSKKFVRKRQ